MVEKIIIDGKEVIVKDNPELMKLIGEARKEEKDKLQSDILVLKTRLSKKEADDGAGNVEAGELKKKIEELEGSKKTVEEQLILIKADQKKAEKKDDGNKKKTDDDVGTKETVKLSDVEKLLAEQKKQFDEVRVADKKDFEERYNSLSTAQKKTDFATYKKEVIKKHSDVLISEFLDVATTKEELDKKLPEALKLSKQYIFKKVDGKRLSLSEIEEADDTKTEGDNGKKDRDKKVIYVQAPVPPDSKPDVKHLDNIEDMSQEDYNNNSTTILAALKKQMNSKKTE